MTNVIGKKLADEYLEQSGILGMHWGIRRSDAELDRLAGRRTTKKEEKARAKAVKSSRRVRKLSRASDDDIKKIISRLNLERQYKDLNKSSLLKGAKIASDLLAKIGKASIPLMAMVLTYQRSKRK